MQWGCCAADRSVCVCVQTNKDDVRQRFEKHGEILDVRLVRDPATKQSRYGRRSIVSLSRRFRSQRAAVDSRLSRSLTRRRRTR